MALAPPSPVQDRKRVKVYELKNNDWYDRGTGFCQGHLVSNPSSLNEAPDARILVHSEEDPNRQLLETRITKDDGYQKQQDTLIVWTESNGVDMALSFQEADGCSTIWDFVSEVQTRLAALAPEDGLSDDLLDPVHPIILPDPQLGHLDEIESAIRAAATTPSGRDALSKFIMSPDYMYILKLGPLVTAAEEVESTADLHRLCTIMKHLILLNDTSIIEFVVTDAAIMGVVGALEYDPDFPSHRANHRQYLSDSSKFKEVVKIEHAEIRKKIHYTYRLLYLKDVVLARILDDPTFSVLNSLIFFHQVDIVNHLQSNQQFLRELFAIFSDEEKDPKRKKEGVLFIQNCCAVAKNIQAQSRAQLFQNFINHDLFNVITFALRHHDAAVRVAGTDVLVALIDHDPHMVRNHIFTAIRERATPLTDTLIQLLLVEVDLGVKSQMADAIKILLDPSSSNAMDMMSRQANADLAKQRGQMPNGLGHSAPQTEAFIQSFYDESAKRLFAPLKALEHRTSMLDLTAHEYGLFTHLVEVLCFFVRQHSYKSKLFILGENLHSRIAQLLQSKQKYMKLTALKWFRTCIGLQDESHYRYIVQNHLFEPILTIVEDTMPRDNLLNSACLELFEYVKRESVKQLIVHLVETYRDRISKITYVNTFQNLVTKYEQMQTPYGNPNVDGSSFTTQEGTPQRVLGSNESFVGLKEMDQDEEAYFNAEEEDDDDDDPTTGPAQHSLPNGASPVKPLVDYPLDDDEDMETLTSSPESLKDRKAGSSSDAGMTNSDSSTESMDVENQNQDEEPVRGRVRTPRELGAGQSPPESIAVKRRREDDDDDELGKTTIKRRNSSASLASQAGRVKLDSSDSENGVRTGHTLRRKGNFKSKNDGNSVVGKFSIKPISMSPSLAAAKRAVDAVDENVLPDDATPPSDSQKENAPVSTAPMTTGEDAAAENTAEPKEEGV